MAIPKWNLKVECTYSVAVLEHALYWPQLVTSASQWIFLQFGVQSRVLLSSNNWQVPFQTSIEWKWCESVYVRTSDLVGLNINMSGKKSTANNMNAGTQWRTNNKQKKNTNTHTHTRNRLAKPVTESVGFGLCSLHGKGRLGACCFWWLTCVVAQSRPFLGYFPRLLRFCPRHVQQQCRR